MTEIQRLQLKASELRSKLAKSEDAEEQDKLVAEYGDVEREIRVKMVADDVTDPKEGEEGNDPAYAEEDEDVDAEDREFRSMLGKARIATYFDAVRTASAPQGVEAELQQHVGIAPNQIPLDVLMGPREQRAVTPPAGTTGLNQQPIEDYVFPAMVASHLRIPQPRVASGSPLYPDIATQATVGGPHQDSTSVNETTGSFASVSVSPARFQASFFWRRTDAAKFAGMDAALRMNLQDALTDKLDSYLLAQLAGSSTIAKNTAPTKADTYQSFLDLFALDRVDGRWVRSTNDIRSVVGPATFKTMAKAYSGSYVGAADSSFNILNDRGDIAGSTMGIRVSAHIAAPASNIQTNVMRLGNRRDAVYPMWEGITLINDEVTKAASGEIVVTAILLANFALLRKDGFYLARTYHAS